MIPAAFEYHRPTTLDEAVALIDAKAAKGPSKKPKRKAAAKKKKG